jgi:hypothetical protein
MGGEDPGVHGAAHRSGSPRSLDRDLDRHPGDKKWVAE